LTDITELAQDTPRTQQERFAAMTQRIQLLLDQGRRDEFVTEASQFVDQSTPAGHQFLIKGLLNYQRGDFIKSLQDFEQACANLNPQDFPSILSPWSMAYLNVQVAMSRRDRPATARGYHHFKANLSALREVDGELAEQISRSPWPENLVLVDFWGRLHFIEIENRAFMFLPETMRIELDKRIHSREPIGFGGIGTGQELIHCLDHQVDILYGMTRAHYVFEHNSEKLKALLHLRDFSKMLRSKELVLFGGSDIPRRAKEFFDTARYPTPNFAVGVPEIVYQCNQQINAHVAATTPVEQVKAYYRSEEFRKRQGQIAAGAVIPRVMIDTCRWTTFLKYCAADFDKAFRQIGCETRFLIEENDVQTMLPALVWRELDVFKPDVFFMVSHARPSISYLPSELPFICYMQDKCGPLLSLPSLKEHIRDHDLFVCMVNRFVEHLQEKGVGQNQIVVMPIPADEEMFYPLPEDHPQKEAFQTDISFVKHGGAEAETIFRQFLNERRNACRDANTRQLIEKIFSELYQRFCLNPEAGGDEPPMQALAAEQAPTGAAQEFRRTLSQWVTIFYLTAYSAAWRYQFLEKMAEGGLSPMLYGNGWENNKRLSHLNRGPVDRNTQLNLVYNFSRINLSINQGITMHQRLSECGLAGGFMMVANHPEERDWLPAKRYFTPDKEIVLFDSSADLIEKCRYYLAHDQQRLDIAASMHERCLREQTCRMGAKKILDMWRQILQNTNDAKK
jgi:spore maturation protein CgeB